MPLGSRDADPVRGTPTPARQAGIAGSVATIPPLLPPEPVYLIPAFSSTSVCCHYPSVAPSGAG
jgi:hypothetical protein